MILSRACNYGILATLYIAKEERSKSGYTSIRKLSKELNISFHFLTKILQTLTSEGILHSHKGPKGGVMLAKKAEEITILDLIYAIDGPDIFFECVLGLPGCGNERPCPLHDQWAEVRENLKAMFEGKTLADTAGEIEEMKLRLSSFVKGEVS